MRFVALALALLVACAADPALPTRCTPNTTVACLCPGGGPSTQVCSSDGAGYSICLCDVRDASGGGGDVADASSAEDRPDVTANTDAGTTPVDAALPPPVDAGPAGDVVAPTDTGCPAGRVVCNTTVMDPVCVDLQQGVRRPDGTTAYCGSCSRGCSAGLPCVRGVCGGG